MSLVAVRKANIGDESTLAHIQTESWKSAFRGILSDDDLEKLTDICRVTEMYKNVLRDHPESGSVLTVDGIPHCIAFWGVSRESDMPGWAELSCIHSLPENRHRGYGSVMLDHILCEIKNAGFEKVMLWVFAENLRARKFYEKFGFCASEKTKDFCGAKEIMYCKNL